MLSIVSGTRGVALKADVTSIFIGELYFCCSQPPGSLHLFSFCGNSDSSRISESSNGLPSFLWHRPLGGSGGGGGVGGGSHPVATADFKGKTSRS